MADIGNTGVGGTDRPINGVGKGARITMPAAGETGVTISAYLADSATGDSFRAAIISDSDKQTVLASSDIRTDVSTAGWYTFSGGGLASFAPANGTTYVIALFSNSAANANMYYSDLGQDGWAASGPISSINPLVLGAAMTADTNRDYSIYMTYTEAEAGEEVTGDGALTLGDMTLEGSGARGVQDTGGAIALTLGNITLAGEGTVTASEPQEITGTGALTLGELEVDGVGIGPNAKTGTGALLLGGIQVEATAVRGISGSGALTLSKPIVNGLGAGVDFGERALRLPAAVPTKKRAIRYAHGRRHNA